MMSKAAQQLIVIDKQDYWRTLSETTLRAAGYAVDTLASYDYTAYVADPQHPHPDLVILGCSTIGPEEKDLIGEVLEHKHQLVVMSTALPWALMRSLFLLGAKDVADKSYDPAALVHTVETVLHDANPRSAYEQARQEERP
jgi:DNA-binding response OmpR family regulator